MLILLPSDTKKHVGANLIQTRHPEEARSAVSKDERPGLSSFETHRCAMLLWMTTTKAVLS
jgi:hypothetical protein